MADSSSTSSSDVKSPIQFGVPWALMGAIALVIAFEITLRCMGPMPLIAFASDEGQYHAVRDTIDAKGPADIALIGSSQLREGITMPVLTDGVSVSQGRATRVANYALRGARVDVFDALVRYLQRQPKRPRLIVVGLSPRDLRAEAPDWPRLAIFWNAADWWREFHKQRNAALNVLPIVIRNEAGRVCWSLRYREEISLSLRRTLVPFGIDAAEESNPILGEETAQHHGMRGLFTIVTTSVPMRRLFDRVRDSYLADEKALPKEMVLRLHSLAGQFNAGRPGLWVEVPGAPPLREWLRKLGQQSQFEAAVAKAIQKTDVKFIPADAIDPPLGSELFRDLQHLNRPGAGQYSRWLAGRIGEMLKSYPLSRVPTGEG